MDDLQPKDFDRKYELWPTVAADSNEQQGDILRGIHHCVRASHEQGTFLLEVEVMRKGNIWTFPIKRDAYNKLCDGQIVRSVHNGMFWAIQQRKW